MTVKENDARRLALVGSENRAAVLAEIANEASPAYGRKLLAEWFNMCDALAPWTAELRSAFERCGYVTDTDERLELPVVVYRAAWEDDDTASALSWTTDLEFAKRFCKGLTSMRARFLGIYRDDVDAFIYEANCTRAYGYLTSRGESEVIAAEVEDIHAVAQLVAVPA